MNRNLKKIVIDGREFATERITGIGRVLSELTVALNNCSIIDSILLFVNDEKYIPTKLRKLKKLKSLKIPNNYFSSEKALTFMTKQNVDLYLSPYPKLPILGINCPSINIVHDVFYITNHHYGNKISRFLRLKRLKHALKRASITWYDSEWSLRETEKLAGFAGNNPRVRYPSIDGKFYNSFGLPSDSILEKYNLKGGYILVTGNGRPHKNLGVLLEKANQINRKIVFIGVSYEIQQFWKQFFPMADVIWIRFVNDEELPVLISNAFCLAQPSKEEGFGYPPLEAMACGTPVVISDIPVLLETTGGNAIVADRDDSDSWLKAFQWLEIKEVYQNQVKKGLNWSDRFSDHLLNQNQISDIMELIG